ncbi:TetR/AcrR family transcriptional regulator [Mesorhizobium sp. CAU 1732]|uniref:TetR/AcrR family transcriptional regulator n=1 Tax=Mesorhizobium sp. CAU 1732 TaxID=3140358 RepID=UPI0032606CCD
MRVTKEKARENRERIVDTAAMLFREQGFDRVGVAQLMEQAGFTHGGFYNHFASKDELIAEALARCFDERSEQYAGHEAIAIVERYLSRDHRDAPGRGCPAAALGSDASRQSDETRSAFAAGVENMIAAIEKDVRPKQAHDPVSRARAISVLAQAVGAMILSRACPESSSLADDILDTCRAECISIFDNHGERELSGES